jgi:redox-sensitive bicupin YhaK (pirin superfamily)
MTQASKHKRTGTMIEHQPFDDIGGTQTEWLNAKHHFAIGHFGKPTHRPVGVLYVWNDDELAPHSGFPLHSHADVEIVTYVRQGVLTHEDSLGNQGHIGAGDVQVMSAGSGIQHSERNEVDAPTQLFQLWIRPRELGGLPRWAHRPFPGADRAGQLVLLASGRSRKGALPIGADADVFGAKLDAGITAEIALAAGDGAYLVPVSGIVEVNGVRVSARDGLAARDEPRLRITAVTDSDLILVIAGQGCRKTRRSPPALPPERAQRRCIWETEHCLSLATEAPVRRTMEKQLIFRRLDKETAYG